MYFLQRQGQWFLIEAWSERNLKISGIADLYEECLVMTGSQTTGKNYTRPEPSLVNENWPKTQDRGRFRASRSGQVQTSRRFITLLIIATNDALAIEKK